MSYEELQLDQEDILLYDKELKENNDPEDSKKKCGICIIGSSAIIFLAIILLIVVLEIKCNKINTNLCAIPNSPTLSCGCYVEMCYTKRSDVRQMRETQLNFWDYNWTVFQVTFPTSQKVIQLRYSGIDQCTVVTKHHNRGIKIGTISDMCNSIIQINMTWNTENNWRLLIMDDNCDALNPCHIQCNSPTCFTSCVNGRSCVDPDQIVNGPC